MFNSWCTCCAYLKNNFEFLNSVFVAYSCIMSTTEDFSDSGSEYQPIPEENHTGSETDISCDENIMQLSLPEPGTSKSRKRLINKENWTVNKRKLSRNSGMEYRTKMGVEKNAKIFENIDCGCPKKCFTLFTENERQEMFESFWNLKDSNQQNAYLYALVQKATVNRKRPIDQSGAGKNVSFKYFLKSNVKTQPVCKKYFLKTFQISDGRLQLITTSTGLISDG